MGSQAGGEEREFPVSFPFLSLLGGHEEKKLCSSVMWASALGVFMLHPPAGFIRKYRFDGEFYARIRNFADRNLQD